MRRSPGCQSATRVGVDNFLTEARFGTVDNVDRALLLFEPKNWAGEKLIVCNHVYAKA